MIGQILRNAALLYLAQQGKAPITQPLKPDDKNEMDLCIASDTELPKPDNQNEQALDFAVEKMHKLLEHVSERLDKNYVFQVAAVCASVVFMWEGPGQETIQLPLGFSVPGYAVGVVIPLILIKLMMDWGYESYQYLITRRYLSPLLNKRLEIAASHLPDDRPVDVLLPASMYKFLYYTEVKDQDPHMKAKPQESWKIIIWHLSRLKRQASWTVIISHLSLIGFVIITVWMNYLLVLYYFKPYGYPMLLPGLGYPIYFVLHWVALRNQINVWWYPFDMAILIGLHLVTFAYISYYGFPWWFLNLLGKSTQV
jgi:hypothetical protein